MKLAGAAQLLLQGTPPSCAVPCLLVLHSAGRRVPGAAAQAIAWSHMRAGAGRESMLCMPWRAGTALTLLGGLAGWYSTHAAALPGEWPCSCRCPGLHCHLS